MQHFPCANGLSGMRTILPGRATQTGTFILPAGLPRKPEVLARPGEGYFRARAHPIGHRVLSFHACGCTGQLRGIWPACQDRPARVEGDEASVRLAERGASAGEQPMGAWVVWPVLVASASRR